MELVEVGGVEEALAAVDAIEDRADHAQDDSTQPDSRTMRRDRGRPAIERAPRRPSTPAPSEGIRRAWRPTSHDVSVRSILRFCTLAVGFSPVRSCYRRRNIVPPP